MTAPLRIPTYDVNHGDTGGQCIPICVRLSSYHDERMRTRILFEMNVLKERTVNVFGLP